MRGEIGRLDVGKGRVSGQVPDLERLSAILKEDAELGEREADELGFRNLNGFVIIGERTSVAFAKNEAVIVDNQSVDWNDLLVHYGLDRIYLSIGAVLTFFSILLYYFVLGTRLFNYFAPEARLYVPTLLLLLGLTMLGISRSRPTYRFRK